MPKIDIAAVPERKGSPYPRHLTHRANACGSGWAMLAG